MSCTQEFNPRQESRFAVVMYGGVSLAIYINGVAQELFNLVRSTAPDTDPKSLGGSAIVYRELGEKLGTRFVVDVLSGTSAGGINAVFLAKALANNQDMEKLESLWVQEGDIQKLINDRLSAKRLKSPAAKRSHLSPKALLNGGRMYEKLLDALNGMEQKGEDGKPRKGTALVDKLDLFVTATDLEGLPIQIRLADRLVTERDHQHVFHFQMPGHNADHDFTSKNNRVLAFAARATSSFPFAFEPVRACDFLKEGEDWSPFFGGYPGVKEGKLPEAVATRSFADGGYLDNKPFSYAIDSIIDRSDDGLLPVDRKLLYIEPSPEDVPGNHGPNEDGPPPDAISNTVKTFTLARYETIRQDIDLLLARNQLIERVARILKGTDEDLWSLSPDIQPSTVDNWFKKDLGAMIGEQGTAYGGYLRLRVARLTDELSGFIATRAGFAPDSDAFLATRQLVRVWRDAKYQYRRSAPKEETFHEFILDYDLGFHLRRLRYLYDALDRLRTDKEERARVLEGQGLGGQVTNEEAFAEELHHLGEVARKARNNILAIRKKAQEATKTHSTGDVFPFDEEKLISDLLGHASDPGRRAAAAKTLEEWQGSSGSPMKDRMEELLRPLEQGVTQALDEIKAVKRSLGLMKNGKKLPWKPGDREKRKQTAQWLAAFCFRMFPHYDLVSFPILQTPGLGEEINNVEIIRVSPDDPARLGGSRLAHFGGFFDQVWREADILQGRLDGAKRIIHALLPEPQEDESWDDFKTRRDGYVEEAQTAIMDEVLARPSERMDLLTSLVLGDTPATRSWVRRKFGRRNRRRIIKELTIHKDFRKLMLGGLTGGALLKRFEAYRVEEHMEPALVVRTLSRSVRVAGRMFSGIADDAGSGPGKKVAGWVATVGGVATGLAEVLLPGSWLRLLVRRPLELLVAFSLVFLLLSRVLDVQGTGGMAALLLGFAVIFVLVGQRLERAVRVGRFGPGGLWIFLWLTVVALAVLGLIHLPATIESAIAMFTGGATGPAG